MQLDSQTMAQLLTHGSIYRRSRFNESIFTQRHGALFEDGFSSFKALKKSKRLEMCDQPSRVWKFSNCCTVGKLFKQNNAIILDTLKTSAQFRSNDKAVTILWCFTIKWPSKRLKEKLVLGFSAEDKAMKWRLAFVEAIKKYRSSSLTSKKSILMERTYNSIIQSVSKSDEYDVDEVLSDTAQQESDEDPSEFGSSAELATPRNSYTEATPSSFVFRQNPLINSCDIPSASLWRLHKQHGGLHIYKEPVGADRTCNSYMTSTVCNKLPEDVFAGVQQLLLSKQRHPGWPFELIKISERSQDSQVVHLSIHPGERLWPLCYKRDTVLNHRICMSEDGSYVILLQQVDNHVRTCRGHVRANIQHITLTCSPTSSTSLDPQDGGHETNKTLLTMVVSGDLNMQQFPCNWLARVFVGISEQVWMEDLVSAVAMVKEKVETPHTYSSKTTLSPLALIPPSSLPTSPFLNSLIPSAPDDQSGNLTARSLTQHPASLFAHSSFKEPRVCTTPRENSSSASLSLSEAHLISSKGKQLTQSRSASSPRSPKVSRVPSAVLGNKRSWLGDQPPAPIPLLDCTYWSSPGSANMRVRGPTYLTTRKKIDAKLPMLRLAATELLSLPHQVDHVSRFLPCVRRSSAPFLLVITLTLPWQSRILYLVIVLQYDRDPRVGPVSPVGGPGGAAERLLQLWSRGEGEAADAARNDKLKLIPSMVDGSWVVKQCVGQKPVMLGRKLQTKYQQGPNYLEVDIDISANSTAATVTSMVAGVVRSVVLDIGVLLEGQSDDELPEQLLGTVRLQRLDLNAAYIPDLDYPIPSIVEENKAAQVDS